jgi:putative aldouronate transport system permease protein
MKAKYTLANVIRHRTFYLMFLPALTAIILFRYVPMSGIVIAFKEFNFMDGIYRSPWVGLAQFDRFLHNNDFWRVFRNTIIISLMKLGIAFPFPIIFALLVNEVRHTHFKRLVQTISYLPHFVSWVIIAGIFYTLLSPSIGIAGGIIRALGGTPPVFMGEPRYFRFILVLSTIWKETGWGAIIYIAALAGVPPELYEAAIVDGAGRMRRVFSVSLPSIMPTISIMLILRVGSLLTEGFDQIVAMLNNAVMNVGETIQYYVYIVGLTTIGNYSYAAAIDLFNSLIGLCLVLVTNHIAKRLNEDGGLY